MAEPIGEIPVVISGDYAQLQKDLAAAEGIAMMWGKKIGDALGSAGAGARVYSTDAESLIATQKKLDIELINAKGTLTEIQNAFEDGAVSANVLARAESELKAAADAANIALKQETETNRAAAAATKEHAAELKKMFSDMQQAGLALTAAVTVPIVGIGLAALKMSEQLNAAQIAFTTMLGSAQKASAFIEELKAFAASTPFQFPELVEASKRMMALGFAAKDVIPTLRSIGDAVALLGGGAEKINRITLALGQMQAKGKVSAQEMNQLAEAGIPAWDMLSKKIGISIPEAMKLAEKGAIAASIAIPTILEGMNEKFAGGMDKLSKTLTGVWSNFQDQSTFILADIGKALVPVMQNLVTDVGMPLLQWVKSITEAFSKLDPAVQTSAIGLAALAAAAGPVLAAVGLVAQGFTAVSAAAVAMGLSLNAIPWVAIVAGAATLTASIWKLHEAEDARDKATQTQVDSLAKLEISLRQQGINISDLSDKYNHGLISEMAYVKGLQELAKAHGDALPPTKELGAASEDLALKQLRVAAAAVKAKEAAAAAAKELAHWNKATNEMQSAVREENAQQEKLNTLLAEFNVKVGDPRVKKWTEDIEKLNIAAMRGDISWTDFGNALADFNKKTRDLQLDEIARDAALLDDKIRKLTTSTKPLENAFLQSETAAMALESTLSGMGTPVAAEFMSMANAAKVLGITIGESGEATTKAKLALDSFLHNSKSLGDMELAWSKASAAIRLLAKSDLPAAVAEYQKMIEKAAALGASQGELLQLQEQQMQLIVQEKTLRGEMATDAVVRLEQIRQEQQILIDQSTTIGQVYVSLRKTFNDAFEALEKGLSDAILSGKNLGDVFVNVGKQIASSILDTIIKGALKPLQDELNKTGGMFDTLAKNITKSISGIGSFKSAASGIGSGEGLQGGGLPGGANQVGSDIGSGEVGDLSNSSLASQGVGSTLGTALGTGGDVAAIATAAMTAYMLIVLKRMEKDLARVEVTTRGMLNQLISLQGTFNTYLPELTHLVNIWAEIMVTNDILRLMGQNGGGLGNGTNNGADPDFAQHLADAINNNPSNSEVDTSMTDLAKSLNDGVQAANDYNAALQTTASTAYSLDSAVSKTTDGLLALNEATKALPGFVDGMDRAIFNSMAGPQGEAGPNLTPGGPRMNATPYIMPVPVPDALTGPGGLMQGSMLAHSNISTSYPSIAPVVGGPGVTRGGAATVYVTAVDPTSRSVTQGIITGLEEVGIRTR